MHRVTLGAPYFQPCAITKQILVNNYRVPIKSVFTFEEGAWARVTNNIDEEFRTVGSN